MSDRLPESERGDAGSDYIELPLRNPRAMDSMRRDLMERHKLQHAPELYYSKKKSIWNWFLLIKWLRFWR